MSLYLTLDLLKQYLRITDTIDDALLQSICDAVEAQQFARLRADAYSGTFYRAQPSPFEQLGVVFDAYGYGVGPFTWTFGDGMPDATTAAGETAIGHVYDAAGTYATTLEAPDATGALVVLASLSLDVPLTAAVADGSAVLAVPYDVMLAAQQRGARLYARRASPEGIIPLGDLGVARVPRFDVDIDALESPWRDVVLS
jgi:hypothetical protein